MAIFNSPIEWLLLAGVFKRSTQAFRTFNVLEERITIQKLIIEA